MLFSCRRSVIVLYIYIYMKLAQYGCIVNVDFHAHVRSSRTTYVIGQSCPIGIPKNPEILGG